jgi:hypothetical protein
MVSESTPFHLLTVRQYGEDLGISSLCVTEEGFWSIFHIPYTAINVITLLMLVPLVSKKLWQIYSIYNLDRRINGRKVSSCLMSPLVKLLHFVSKPWTHSASYPFSILVFLLSLLQVHPEAVFLNFNGAQKSIPRNRFRQPMYPGGPLREPYSYLVPSPIDCSKIPALAVFVKKFQQKRHQQMGFFKVIHSKGCINFYSTEV